jgi:hypothetical protein
VCMVLTCMTLLIPAFALLFAPPVLSVGLLRYRTLPYHLPLLLSLSFKSASETEIQSFGTMLEPRYVVGARALDQ